MSDSDGATGSQSVQRALDLLALVAERHATGAGMPDIVAQSGLTRPTAHRLVSALVRAGLVMQDEADGRYYLGPNSYALGVVARDRFGLDALSEASVDRLAEASMDTAFFSLRNGINSVCLRRQEGRFPIRSHVLYVGQRHPLGVAAHGIAMLAALPDDEVEEIISVHTPTYAAKYPKLTPEVLRSLVEETRETGYAMNRGLFFENAWAIGVVVRGLDGQVTAALSVAAMKDRLGQSRQEELAALLTQEAEILQKAHRKQALLTSAPQPDGPKSRGRKPRSNPQGGSR